MVYTPTTKRFLIIGGIIFIIWFLIYHVFQVGMMLDAPLIRFQSYLSARLLSGMGFEAELTHLTNSIYTSKVTINESRAVIVGGECGALELLVLFSGLLLAYGGNKRQMAWFLPLGLIVILILNILRISGLAIINFYWPKHLEFNHKYVFVLIVYGVIFWLWYVWINYLSGSRST